MSTETTGRVFYCAYCTRRSRCLPLTVMLLGVKAGGKRALTYRLELCPSCKVAWLDHHLNEWSPARRPVHEGWLKYPKFKPRDVSDLELVQAWTPRKSRSG